MTFWKCTFFIFLYGLLSLGRAQDFFPDAEVSSYVSTVLKYLNSNPTKSYIYKEGYVTSAQKKANIIEIVVDVSVDCINDFPEIPCSERVLTCHAFVGLEPPYQVLSDVNCSPKIEISIENVDQKSPISFVSTSNNQEKDKNIDLSVEPVSGEQGVDFVAVRRDAVPCLGCPFDLAANASGVDELIAAALKHVESEKSQRHAVITVQRLQRQVVAGVKYILLLEIAATTCLKEADLSAPCPLDTNTDSFVCEVTFIEKPWLSNNKHIIKNNCTVSQEFIAPVGRDRSERDDINNEVHPFGGYKKPTNAYDQSAYDAIAESGNMDDLISPGRLADLESQILFGERSNHENRQNFRSEELLIENQRPETEEAPIYRYAQQVSGIRPILPFTQEVYYVPILPEIDEPMYTIYEPQSMIKSRQKVNKKSSKENLIEKVQPIAFNVHDDDRLKRESDKSSEEDSKSVSDSSEEQKRDSQTERHYIEGTTLSIIDAETTLPESSSEKPTTTTTEKFDTTTNEQTTEIPDIQGTETPDNDIVKREEQDPNQKDEMLRLKREVKKDDSSSSSSSSSSNDNDDAKNNDNKILKNKSQKDKKDNSSSSSSSESDEKAKKMEKKSKEQKNDSSSSDSSSDEEKRNRHKRSVGQLEKITPDEKVIVRDLADFAAASLDKIDDDNQKRVILQILGAKKLKLEGIYYQIILRLGISRCLESDHSEHCREKLFTNLTKICKVQVHVDDDYSNPKVVKSQCQNIKKDEHDRNRTNYSRYKRSLLVGGHTPMATDDPRVQEFVTASLSHLDSQSSGENKYKAIEILSASSQVVAGALYKVKVKIGESDCKKTDSKPVESCQTSSGVQPKICTVEVWDRIWLKKRQYTIQCGEKEYTFAAEIGTSARKRRSLLGEDSQQPIHPKAQHFIKMGLEWLSAKSNYNRKYALRKIRQVSKQTVAGALWRIDTIIEYCPVYIEPVSPCQADVCTFSVLDQPWLIDGLHINISCENDNTVYSFKPGSELYEGENAVNGPILKTFNQFIEKHNKVYKNKDEFNYRLKTFKENLKIIANLNKYDQGTARYGITEFADLTPQEFSKMHGLRPHLQTENEVPLSDARIPNIPLPTEFDWREKGAVTEVKNQGMCGSCWAFSVTGNIEGQYAIKYGKLLEFSEQELVDCDKVDNGCAGGYMYNAYSAIEKIGGLEQESDYPYEGEDEKCYFNKGKVAVELSGAVNISHNETDMAKWLIKNGPISIAINANAMQFYMGGISHPWKTLCNPKDLDHGVLIVGFGVHKYSLFNKILPFWIVKNSWGTSWGEQGYYRVYRGDGTCGLNETPSSAIVI